MATPRTRARRPPAGPLVEVARHRLGAWHAIAWLALDGGARRLGVAQDMNHGRRGMPEHLLRVFDVRGGPLRDLDAARASALCGGCEWLRDGRLAYALRRFAPDSGMTLGALEPTSGVNETIVEAAFSHPDSRAPMGVSRDGCVVAFATPRGAAVLEVGAQGAPWRERACVGGPAPAYPQVALAPEADAVVWVDDGYQPLRCFETPSGRLRWSRDHFEGWTGPRGLEALRFGAECVVVLVRTTVRSASAESTRRTVRAYSAATGEPVHLDLAERAADATSVAVAPSGSALAVGDAAGRIRLLALGDPARDVAFEAFAGATVTALAFDAGATHLAAGSAKGDVVVYALPDASGTA